MTKLTKVQITKEEYIRLKEMFSSKDTENHTLAFGIINNMNIKHNFPYILMLYKLYINNSLVDAALWKPVEKNLKRQMKKINKSDVIDTHYNTIVKIILKYYPEFFPVVVEEFIRVWQHQLSEIGYEFIDKIDFSKVVAKE